MAHAPSASVSNALRRDLAEIVGHERVLTSFPDRVAYNADCWPRGIILTRGRELGRHLPGAVVQPKNEHEVMAIVQWARRTSTPIVPFGAGSGVCGGTLADGDGVVVDLKRLNRIVETRASDMHARIQSGAIGQILETELNRRKLTLGHYPSSIYCSSFGGWIAGRGAGQYSSRYGKIEDMVSSLRVVLGTGEVVETCPDPLATKPRYLVPDAGPDLTQLMIGSEGTLGLITEGTVRIDRLPDRRIYRGFQFHDVNTALEAIREMMQLGIRPAVVRLYDAFDSLLARRGSGKSDQPTSLRARALTSKLSSMAMDILPAGVFSEVKGRMNDVTRGILKRVLGQPMTLNAVIDILPGDCLLIVGFEGHNDLVEAEAFCGYEVLERYGVDLGSEPGEHWYAHRMDVSYKQSPMYDAGAFVDTMEVSTTWSNLPRLYDSVRRALAPHVLVMAHFSHVYSEGSSIYFTFAGFGDGLEDTLRRYKATWQTGLDTVARAGGSVAHHHGVGLSKSPWTHHDHPGGRGLFDALKETFDPDGIMNPGKVYPAEDA
jgi:alkyldihydroxyacetonephosphate synthase